MAKPEYNKDEFDFLVNKIRKKERFSVLSFGDGEWSMVLDRESNIETAEREPFSEEVWIGLLQALNISQVEDVYLTTTTNTKGEVGYEDLHERARQYLQMMNIQVKDELKDARLFYDILLACYEGDTDALRAFADFINVLNKAPIIIVGGEYLENLKKEKFLKNPGFITTPDGKASRNLNDIIYPILMYRKPAIFLLSCGIATNMIIKEVHARIPESSFIDVGALWDFILMEGGRADKKLEGLKDKLKKRLRI